MSKNPKWDATPRRLKLHYSGGASRQFWNRVDALKGGPDYESMNSCGVLLRNLEGTVLQWLENAELKRKRAAKRAKLKPVQQEKHD